MYLAVVLDRFSRRVIGWSLDRSLAVRLTVAALQQAIASRQPAPGLVHHSDRGVQYASREYVELLQSHDITPSMSRTANPYDNAFCESFMKTLKYEEIHCRQYQQYGGPVGPHGGIYRSLLQPGTAALGSGLPVTGRV